MELVAVDREVQAVLAIRVPVVLAALEIPAVADPEAPVAAAVLEAQEVPVLRIQAHLRAPAP